MQKSTMAKNEVCQANRKWYEIDATGLILGDLAVATADILRGKTKPTWTPNVDCGDYVIIRNSDKIRLSGNKAEKENWYNHSMYIGGLRTRSGREMIEKYSDELITTAVHGMIPKNRLGREIIKKLFVYKDFGKPHDAQSPIKVVI